MADFKPQSVLIQDVFPLRRLLSKTASAAEQAKGAKRLDRSKQQVEQRRASIPKSIKYPDALPITAHLNDIAKLLHSNQVLIVAGETGSGKTTQLPKMCLKAGFGVRGKIGHTQPRRIAARTVSKRIADELADKDGNLVGYSVRFSDTTSSNTLIKVLTDGLLLAEVRNDRFLNQYEVIIIDEAHERSLNIDFLLGYLKQLLPRRPDLKLIVTSATIDVEAFSQYFNSAPVVSVSGRGFPVEEIYLENPQELDLSAQVIHCLEEIERQSRSNIQQAQDVLVFLTGEREIFEVAHALRDRFAQQGNHRSSYDVLPLYARLSTNEQQKIFKSSARKRIILATNVAETSITVPNIGYVIDPGQVRISRYSPRSKLQRLPIEAISQASANQRKGRCGRVAPGVCYRLYSCADFTGRAEFTDPEILRTSLASVVLQMRAFRLGDEQTFPFLDTPQQVALKDAVAALSELGAMRDNKLTDTGRLMAKLPVDPRLAKILIAAHANGSLSEALVIVSVLALNDPRERPLEKRQAADQAHAAFKDDKSDFVVFLNIWNWSEQQRAALTRKAYTQTLKKRYLSAVRMREWRDLHRQLLLTCRSNKMSLSDKPANFASLHQALLPGFLTQLGMKDDKGLYLGTRQLKFSIFPGSALFKAQPKWLMCAEIAETGKVYARCNAQIELKWVEQCAKHLLKTSYSEPHWSVKREEVQAYQRMTLYGLPIVERRLVSLGSGKNSFLSDSTFKSAAVQSRELFVAEGLVRGGASTTNRNFLSHNLQLVRQVLAKEDTYRRRDLLLHDDHLIAFYATRIPEQIIDMRSLDVWRKSAEQHNPSILHMDMGDVISKTVLPEAKMFPGEISLGDRCFKLKYKFAPGEVDDGISVQLAAQDLEGISRERLEWLVPGLLLAKCEQLIRNLPKSVRRKLVPVPDVLAELEQVLMRESVFAQGNLARRLVDLIEAYRGVKIDIKLFDINRLDDNNRINIQIRGPNNKLVDQGRSVDELLGKITLGAKSEAKQIVQAETLVTTFPDQGIHSIPTVNKATGHLAGYPALQDRGEKLALVLASSRKEQVLLNRCGYPRLALMQEHKAARFLAKEVSKHSKVALHYATLGSVEALKQELLLTSAWYCFFEGRELPEEKAQFEARIVSHRGELAGVFNTVLAHTRQILSQRFDLIARLAKIRSPAFVSAAQDVQKQLDQLVSGGFLTRAPRQYLSNIARYIEASAYRLDHLQGRVEKDQQSIHLIDALEQRLDNLLKILPLTPELEYMSYLMQELRVLLFAQKFSAKVKISIPRMDKALCVFEALVAEKST